MMCYIPNLLQKNSTNENRDLGKWYETYHTSIDLAAICWLPVVGKVTLDLLWSMWSVFVDSLRASFPTVGGHEQTEY